MIIEKCKGKVKCDMQGCGSMAEYSIKSKAENRMTDLDICEKCLKEIYVEMGKLIVPKGVEAPFKSLNKGRKNR